MSLTHFFFAYALAAGLAVGAMLSYFPASSLAGVPPFLMVLIALAVFDGLCLLRSGGSPEGMISMPIRMTGLAIALIAMVVVTQSAGLPLRLF
jgi:hypothetical protein